MNLLLFSHPGNNSRSIFLDAARGFEKAGHRVLFWELEPMWRAFQREPAARPRLTSDFTSLVHAFITSNKIDACVGMWANALLSLVHPADDGKPQSFFDSIKAPCALFWLDAPHWAHNGEFRAYFGTPMFRGPMLLNVINNRETAREMTSVLGLSHVLALPCGVNEQIFRPYPGEPLDFEIVFGGGPGDPPPTPLALKELDAQDPDLASIRREAADSIRPGLADLAAKCAPQAGALDELFRRLLGAQVENRAEPMLDRIARFRADASLAPAADHLLADPRLFVEVTMRVRGVERCERAFTISYLSRRFRCAIFGSGDYSAWGCRARTFGEVKYEDQARIYSRGRIGLNVMRWQDDAGLNLKCYEITASGPACLVSRRPGLEEQFDPQREVAAFSSPRHGAALARELLDSPDRLADLAKAGRARTLRDHTWTTWAESVAAKLSRAAG